MKFIPIFCLILTKVYTGTEAGSSDEEPEEKICFSVEEGNMNDKLTKNR